MVHLAPDSLTGRSLVPWPQQSGLDRLNEESSAVLARVPPAVARLPIFRPYGGPIGTARVVVVNPKIIGEDRMP